MKLKEIYNLAIKLGMDADPRGEAGVKRVLEKAKEEYEELKEEEKEFFDKERFSNPYSDSRIWIGDPEKEIKKILVGIDIGSSEILLAEKLNVDLVISHHPLGRGLTRLSEVLDLQVDLLSQLGVPINVAESLFEVRISELTRRLSPLNSYKPIDTAKLLNIPLMSLHTPADNLCYKFLKNYVEKGNPETLKDLIKLILKIPEYKEAAKMGMGPIIFAGNPKRRCGKIAFTEITGGTSGSKQIYEWLAKAGVGTIVGMHMEEEHKDEAEKYHINVLIAGHMSSDSLGINLILDQLEKEGIEIIACSGLIRIRRNG